MSILVGVEGVRGTVEYFSRKSLTCYGDSLALYMFVIKKAEYACNATTTTQCSEVLNSGCADKQLNP